MQVVKNILLVVLCCWFHATGLNGQQLTQDDLQINAEDLINSIDLDGQSNSAYISQIGNRNDVLIEQELIGSDANYVNVLQVGRRNSTIISQIGEGNKAFVLQEGIGNEYILSLIHI